MVSMCSIPHHTPRHRKGWTTACKPSSSLFSCYSFQPYILIVHGVWTHCLVRAGLLVAMSSDSCECSLPLALTRQNSEPVSPSSTYKPVIQCQ